MLFIAHYRFHFKSAQLYHGFNHEDSRKGMRLLGHKIFVLARGIISQLQPVNVNSHGHITRTLILSAYDSMLNDSS